MRSMKTGEMGKSRKLVGWSCWSSNCRANTTFSVAKLHGKHPLFTCKSCLGHCCLSETRGGGRKTLLPFLDSKSSFWTAHSLAVDSAWLAEGWGRRCRCSQRCEAWPLHPTIAQCDVGKIPVEPPPAAVCSSSRHCCCRTEGGLKESTEEKICKNLSG